MTESLETRFQSLTVTRGHPVQETLCRKRAATGNPDESEAKEKPSTLQDPYKMDNNPHGYCVILNNSNFTNPNETRSGSDKDAAALKNIFEQLQFKTIVYPNLEAKQIHEMMQEFSSMDHNNMDCFVCCLLSHGDKGIVKGTDWKPAPIKDLVSCFTGSKCPSLANKPKLFFIQACQGEVGQTSVQVEADFCGDLDADAVPLPSIPDWADILIGMATVEDFECYRHREKGSVYIQCLCREMESLCPRRVDLLTILTQVNKEVGEKAFYRKKQMPEIKSTLRKQLIFPVPATLEN
uniref:Caspase-8 n=1 Tax=Sphenodon punctatus TaxID=8508 RepID=A0A8D0G7I9_SPHPU